MGPDLGAALIAPPCQMRRVHGTGMGKVCLMRINQQCRGSLTLARQGSLAIFYRIRVRVTELELSCWRQV